MRPLTSKILLCATLVLGLWSFGDPHKPTPLTWWVTGRRGCCHHKGLRLVWGPNERAPHAARVWIGLTARHLHSAQPTRPISSEPST